MWFWRKKSEAAKPGLEAEVSLSSGERDGGKMSPQMSVPRRERQERATERTTLTDDSLLEVNCEGSLSVYHLPIRG